MSNTILINATHYKEELRVAVVNDNIVNQVDIEAIAKQQTKAFIYKGKVTRIEPSLEACFVDYGEKRHGFLPLKDICPAHYQKEVGSNERPSIKDVLKEGQELIVQVEKIERGNKGAALTTYITLAGSFLVLMPNNPKAGGVSRRIDGPERTELVEILRNLSSPEEVGIIVRTASVGHSQEELQWDLDILLRLWNAISSIAKEKPAPLLIHQESNAMIRALRDYLRPNLDEIVVDDEAIYQEAKKYIELIRPDFAEKVKHYQGNAPLYTHYNIENQVESIFKRELRLPSGGSLSIDQTEALTAIDINSSRATKGSDIEETAYQTNLEAAVEIARQLRLRDIGGLIVIDFIDMMQNNHQRDVEERFRDALYSDRAKVQMGRISRFGLLEMSRQRLRSTLSESTKMVCPHCHGQGHIRSIPSLSLAILRQIEEQVVRADTTAVRAHLPPEVATYLLNEKRDAVVNLEQRHNAKICLIPHINLRVPDYEIERLTNENQIDKKPSYKLAVEFSRTDTPLSNIVSQEPEKVHAPALQTIDLPNKPKMEKRKTKKTPGLLARLLGSLFGKEETKKPTRRRSHNPRHRHHNNNRRGSGSGNTRTRSSNSSNARRSQGRRGPSQQGRQQGGSGAARPQQQTSTQSNAAKRD